MKHLLLRRARRVNGIQRQRHLDELLARRGHGISLPRCRAEDGINLVLLSLLA